MQDIEPYWKWRNQYISEEDEYSPFYKRKYSELYYSEVCYNFYLHPQWDSIGSSTLFIKILYVDYEKGYCVIEFIGEWNDVINNDIKLMYDEVISLLLKHRISRYILIGENVLNFHVDVEDYYVEWNEGIIDNGGWISLVNFQEHVIQELRNNSLDYLFSIQYLEKWRNMQVERVYQELFSRLSVLKLTGD